MLRAIPFIVVAVLLTFPVCASAQPAGPLSFSATLGAVTLNGRPGDVFTRQFQLRLDTNQPRSHFAARFEDWWPSEDGQQSFYAEAGTIRRSCAKWTTVNPVESAVEPGGTLSIRYTVAVPTEIDPGGYWCALTVDHLPDPVTSAGVGVRFVASVSTGVFLYVDPVQRRVDITDLTVTGRTLRLHITNGGNAPIPLDGRLEIVELERRTVVATHPLPRRMLLVDPVAQSTVSVVLPSTFAGPAGAYLVRVLLDIGADHLIGAEREVVIAEANAREAGG